MTVGGWREDVVLRSFIWGGYLRCKLRVCFPHLGYLRRSFGRFFRRSFVAGFLVVLAVLWSGAVLARPAPDFWTI